MKFTVKQVLFLLVLLASVICDNSLHAMLTERQNTHCCRRATELLKNVLLFCCTFALNTKSTDLELDKEIYAGLTQRAINSGDFERRSIQRIKAIEALSASLVKTPPTQDKKD